MRLQHFSQVLFACLTLSSALVLSGCGASATFPNAEAVTAPTLHVMPAIQGSNYGGHAPIVGAKIFLLQVGTSGYGSKVTSLLTSAVGASNTDTTIVGTSSNPAYYAVSDSTGQYNLTGDYTCTAGDVVYVYGSGGNPSTNPNSSYTVTITGASSTDDANGNLLVTFTTTGNQLLYQGESLVFGNIPAPYNAFTGTTQVVSPLNLTTTTFAVELGTYGGNPGSGSGWNTTATQVQPIVNNAAIANMAVLGICPGQFTVQAIPNGSGTATLTGISNSDFAKLAVGDTISGPGLQYPSVATTTISALTPGSGTNTNSVTVSCPNCSGGPEYGGSPTGPYATYTVNTSTNVFNFGSTSTAAVSYIYMNEVSTVAAAFALAPFADTTVNNDALHIGTSSTNLAGLQNAALTANNLYDITGHNSGTGSDGDVHVARLVTPTNLTGSSVPQTLIDTIGDILANCVDSSNTYGVTNTSGTKSAQCTTLFNTATSDGTSTGTKPYDTATAALNIAHHPAGSGATTTTCGGTTSTFACTLYNSLTGNVPFQPYLGSAPNDFTVGITYTGSGLTGANGIAIDGAGDAWIPNGSGAVVELSPAGAVLSGSNGFSTGTSNSSSSIAFDYNGNVWFVNNNAYVMKMNNIGTLLSGSGYSTGTYGPSGCTTPSPTPHGLAIDANDNVWVANYYGDDRGQAIVELNNNGVLQTANEVNTNNNVCNEATTGGNTVVRNVWSLAMDGNGVMYGTGYSSENVAAVNTSTTSGKFTIYNNSGSTSVPDGPAYSAIDQNGKLWMPNYYSGTTAGAGTSVSVFTPGTTSATANATSSVAYTSYSGGGLSGPQAIAVDGGNNIWVANYGSKTISELNNSGTALTPSTGYTTAFSGNVGRIAIDASGNVWVNSPSGNNVVQLVGAATPTLTPLVTAAKNGTPAAKP